MNIRRAVAGDLPHILRLLNAAGLPGNDLSEAALEHFLVLQEEGTSLRGAVGLERYGGIGLLRSLVVTDDVRGKGYGNQLASAVETLAQALGITSLYLLTTSAEPFFRAHGYRPVHREESPPAIQGTTQFSALCPSTAVLMVKP